MKKYDRVILLAVPPWAASLLPESQEVFRLCAGNIFRVRGIDEHGHIELWTRQGKDTSHIASADVIWVDQEDVELVKHLSAARRKQEGT